MECAPKRATRSSTSSPFALNSSAIWSTVLSGEASCFRASDSRETFPSRLPPGTSNSGTPDKTSASRAKNVRISAQDTTPGQLFSSSSLTRSMRSNPRTVFPFTGACFSTRPPSGVVSNNTDPSHPCTLQNVYYEAVVALEADDGGGHAGVVVESLDHMVLDDLLGRRASVAIESYLHSGGGFTGFGIAVRETSEKKARMTRKDNPEAQPLTLTSRKPKNAIRSAISGPARCSTAAITPDMYDEAFVGEPNSSSGLK
nr:Os03g0369250 [Ipomoea batatas]